MSDLAVSVIVVSRHRPQALLRCLTGLRQLYYKPFEVIVVADPKGIDAVTSAGLLPEIKHACFDEANISAARNLGIALAAGDIIAFLDDDAAPEPTWLDHLIAPFTDPAVCAAGGYVRGRNGISFQSRAQYVDHLGVHSAIKMQGDTPIVLQAVPGKAIKTEGTNCAFRRDLLQQIGGFDPAFHFYLDETDVNLRLAAMNAKTAIVPLAQVHHGFAPSAQRRLSRMPVTLFDIGASLAVFLRKHATAAEFEPAIRAMQTEQTARLIRHMIAGTCEPRDVRDVLKTFALGVASGKTRDIEAQHHMPSDAPPFVKFDPFFGQKPATVVAGRSWRRKQLCKSATDLLRTKSRVSVFCFSPTALYHRVSFEKDGFWLQVGGVLGKSERGERAVRLQGFSVRLAREKKRVALVRPVEGRQEEANDPLIG